MACLCLSSRVNALQDSVWERALPNERLNSNPEGVDAGPSAGLQDLLFVHMMLYCIVFSITGINYFFK